MGALTGNRKRGDDYFASSYKTPGFSSNLSHISKKQKVTQFVNQTPDRVTSRSSVSRVFLYPEPQPAFRREVHAPTRTTRFSFSGNSRRSWSRDSVKDNSADKMGNMFSSPYNTLKRHLDAARRSALETFRYQSVTESQEEVIEVRDEGKMEVEGLWDEKVKEVIDLDNEDSKEDVLEDSCIEEMDIVEEGREGQSAVSGQKWNESNGVVKKLGKIEGKSVDRDFRPSSSSLVTEMRNGDLVVHSAGDMLDTQSLIQEASISDVRIYSKLLDEALRRNSKLEDISFRIQLKEKQLQTQQLLRPQKKAEVVKKDVVAEAFTPLSEEENAEVAVAFSRSNWKKILVSHKNSNIDITGELLQCLRPGAWLNDEVINVYLELLKERETREPQKFLKCHFFNTFFYKKLISGRNGYNFQAVRRWTSQKKLGYCLLDCDKIFVPIHKEIHWCLAVINKVDKKFQYLDSLGGFDSRVTNMLVRYYVDEVKDKTGKEIDVSSWGHELVEDLPEQQNGFDCGMFMIKYSDFYSRGVGLWFNQEHMPYFRLRTAKEILRLKAD